MAKQISGSFDFKMELKGDSGSYELRIYMGEYSYIECDREVGAHPITVSITDPRAKPDDVWETLFDLSKQDAINLRNLLGVLIDALP